MLLRKILSFFKPTYSAEDARRIAEVENVKYQKELEAKIEKNKKRAAKKLIKLIDKMIEKAVKTGLFKVKIYESYFRSYVAPNIVDAVVEEVMEVFENRGYIVETHYWYSEGNWPDMIISFKEEQPKEKEHLKLV